MWVGKLDPCVPGSKINKKLTVYPCRGVVERSISGGCFERVQVQEGG